MMNGINHQKNKIMKNYERVLHILAGIALGYLMFANF